MADQHFQVEVEGDHLKKLANAKPIAALAEMLWNACDADATRIDVNLERSELGIVAITVTDNGDGFRFDQARPLFGKLGGSWKANGSRSKREGRMLHGKEGRGRLKALALGRVADWNVRYREGEDVYGYTITLLRDNLIDVRVTEPVIVAKGIGTGVDLRISELDRNFRTFEPETSTIELAPIFALYLTDYKQVKIFVDYQQVDPLSAIGSRESFPLSPVMQDGNDYSVEMDLVQWKAAPERSVFFCGKDGFPYHQITPTFHTPGKVFSAYVKSAFVDALQAQGQMGLFEMNPQLQASYEQAVDIIKDYFRKQDISAAQAEINSWKAERVYPFADEPVNSVEEAEQQVFNIVALNVRRHLPSFQAADRKTKSFQLRMLRQAIEQSPGDLQLVLREVLGLPDNKIKEFARLLEVSSLGNVIGASKLVADRMRFVAGLESILFETEEKKLLKERKHLHRILADNNTWVFGENYALSVDDQSLTAVLRKHRALLGKTGDAGPVQRLDGSGGIVDLMLSRSIPQSRPEQREHLVVELKRPSVKIGLTEIQQIESYAYTISADERFRDIDTRWNFWLISNDLDKNAMMRTRQKDKPRGLIFQSEDGKIDVWVKTWSEVIEDCKGRMRFVQNHLNADIDHDKSLRYLKKTYEKYLAGDETVDEEGDIPSSDDVAYDFTESVQPNAI